MLRFLSGMGGIGAFVTAFVLAVEHAGSRFTMVLGVAIMIPFSLGEVTLGLAAYLVRDWRLLQIVTHLPLLGIFSSRERYHALTVRTDPALPDCSGVSEMVDHPGQTEGGQGHHQPGREREREAGAS